VIAYTDVRHHEVSRVADGIGQATFQRLADEVPIPIVMVDPQGQVLHANQQWWEAVGSRSDSAREHWRMDRRVRSRREHTGHRRAAEPW
jgi:PAS domain-containing protein